MNIKWIGAVMIIAGCAGFGFCLGSAERKQEQFLIQFMKAVKFMRAELQYRLSPLPELLLSVAGIVKNPMREVLTRLSAELERRTSPDVISCMRSVLANTPIKHGKNRLILIELGTTLGKYDMEGQLKGLEHIQELLEYQLTELRCNQKERIRSYRTLCVCAGIALVILFI